MVLIDYTVSLSDDSSNSYFSGRSGDILKNMITNVLDFKIDEIYYTHIVKCKPLNSQAPSNSELDSCIGYLHTQIEFVKPKVIVTLGEDAYKYFTSENENFKTVRGHVIDLKNYKLIPIMHPTHLLRNPNDKKIAFGDLKTIKSCL